jgi:uncharacterized protein YkwD
MIKRMFTVAALVVVVATACTGQGAVETTSAPATDTGVPTALVALTEGAPAEASPTVAASETAATETASTPPTPTPTVGTPVPTNPPDCTNQASFVADITIPDETNVAGGTTFTKTWRIANTGTCVWGPDYTLTHYSGERLNVVNFTTLAVTYPGQNVDVSIDLTAPTNTGRYQGNYVVKNPAGLIMSIGDDSRLWVIINVTVLGAGTATSTATATAISNTAVGPVTATTTASTATTGTAGSSGASSASTAACAFTTDRAKLTEVITAVNTYRAQKGLPAYTVNPQLAQAAQRHANDIACNKLYVHTGTDGSTPRTRVADTGYTASSVSENVNGNYPPLSGQAAVNWWINDRTDPRHGQNLVSTTFTEIGVGYAFFDNYGFYALVFAKP